MDPDKKITGSGLVALSGWLTKTQARLSALLDMMEAPLAVVLVATSVFVGVGTGLAAVVFNNLIAFVVRVAFVDLPDALPWLGRWAILVVPTLGGLVAGPLIYFFAREAKGHGVPEVMEAIALNGGRIRPVVVVVKAIASSLTMGTGGSVGREGPIVQIAAALGSTLGQVLRLSEDRIRNLVACGAAGGIAATFNAPIAGVIFAVEVILGELSVSHIGTVVISAVTASTVMQVINGNTFAFPLPQPYEINHVGEYGFYALLGILAAVVSVIYIRSLYKTEDLFTEQKRLPEWLQPAIGGLLMGALALLYPLIFPDLDYDTLPQIFGGGYSPIEDALSGRLLFNAALVMIFLKMAATNLTLGSGGSGGIFAPSLFMGAMLGLVVGITANELFPGLPAPPGAYALVGMGAVFAGAAQAPMTAVIMLFELTGDYRIILPLMLTVILSTLTVRQLMHGESIYTLKLTRRGVRLQSGRDVDILNSVTVGQIMSKDVRPVSQDMTIVELSDSFSRSHRHGYPVRDERDKLWGIVTVADLDRAVARNLPRRTRVSEIATPYDRLLLAYPDQPMARALALMGTRGLGHLPVVSRTDPHELVGFIWHTDIIRAYNVALTYRAEIQHRAKRMKLRDIDGTEFYEVNLASGDEAVGRRVCDIADHLPFECILISIRRNGKVLIPHGDTVFAEGDQITAFVRSDDAPALSHALRGIKVLST